MEEEDSFQDDKTFYHIHFKSITVLTNLVQFWLWLVFGLPSMPKVARLLVAHGIGGFLYTYLALVIIHKYSDKKHTLQFLVFGVAGTSFILITDILMWAYLTYSHKLFNMHLLNCEIGIFTSIFSCADLIVYFLSLREEKEYY